MEKDMIADILGYLDDNFQEDLGEVLLGRTFDSSVSDASITSNGEKQDASGESR